MNGWQRETVAGGYGHRIIGMRKVGEDQQATMERAFYCENCYRTASSEQKFIDVGSCDDRHGSEERRRELLKKFGEVAEVCTPPQPSADEEDDPEELEYCPFAATEQDEAILFPLHG